MRELDYGLVYAYAALACAAACSEDPIVRTRVLTDQEGLAATLDTERVLEAQDNARVALAKRAQANI